MWNRKHPFCHNYLNTTTLFCQYLDNNCKYPQFCFYATIIINIFIYSFMRDKVYLLTSYLPLLTFRENLCSPQVFSGSVLLIFLVFCVVFSVVFVLFFVFCFVVCFMFFVCLHPVTCVPNVASFSVLSRLDCTFGFT